jgi:hypothetical protein
MLRNTQSTTIEDLVRAVQDEARSDEEVVAVLAHILRTRRIVRPALKEAA